MDKKSYRRSSSSSSSTSSTSSSLTSDSSTSSSDSSYDSRYPSWKGHGSSHKRQSRPAKKSRSTKRTASGSDRTKSKKKSGPSGHHHSSSKGSGRKSGHSGHKDYKEYDMNYRGRSPNTHQRRNAVSKKLLSPVHKRTSSPSASRKSKKISPGSYRKGHKRSMSPRDRLDLQANMSPPERLRDPRLERGLKRSPELPLRYRESPKRYEKDDFFERTDRRQELPVRSREDARSREFSRNKRDHYEEFRREDRDKKLRGYKERIPDDREGFAREADYGPHSSREFFGRVSRESSMERLPYADPYDTFDRDPVRIEGRNRYDDIPDRKLSDFSRRGMPNPVEARYADDRRKGGSHHDPWLVDHRVSSSGHPEGDSHSYPRRGHHEWDKTYHRKRRDWHEDIPRDDWNNKGNNGGRGWGQSRRHHAQWDESEPTEWSGPASKRGGRSPNVSPTKAPPVRPPTPKTENKPFVPEIVEKTPPRLEPDTKEKVFTPVSPTGSPVTPVVAPSTPPEPVPDPAPSKENSLVDEKDNFSDVSDDSDDILNQEPVDIIEENTDPVIAEDAKSITQETTPFDAAFEDEDSKMDLEEISDDDLEEEKQIKYSVADALDIDWSTLKVEPHTEKPPQKTSAIRRFSAANLLSSLGVSTKYARPEVIERVRKRCIEVEKDKRKTEAELKKACDEDEHELPTIKQEEVTVKEEPMDESIEEEPIAEILPVVFSGGVVRTIKYEENKRSRIFRLGPNRKALSLADDVVIRRRICNQPDDETFYENFSFDPQLFNQAAQLMKSCT